MSRQLEKYAFDFARELRITMPAGAVILKCHFYASPATWELWAIADPDLDRKEPRHFAAYHRGDVIPDDAIYLNSEIDTSDDILGTLSIHFFELPETA